MLSQRSPRVLGLLLALAVVLPIAGISSASLPGSACWEAGHEPPRSITAVGSTTQLSVHLNQFLPAYYSRCPDANGTISYDPLGDAAAADAIIKHSRGGDLTKPYTMYTTDLALSPAEKEQAEFDTTHPFRPRTGSNVNHFPVFANGFAIAYNLGGCSTSTAVNVDGRTMSLIFQGLITRWNDPNLVSRNPELSTCNTALKVATRADEDASSVVIKDYLSNSDPIWNLYKQKQLNTTWPSTLVRPCLAASKDGMNSCLDRPGYIGYLEYGSAKTGGHPLAAIQNSSGVFVTPSTASTLAWPDNCSAAETSSIAPSSSTALGWTTFSLTKATAGYPICAYSYILTFQRLLYASDDTLGTGQMRNTVDYLGTIAQDSVLDAVTAQGFAPVPAAVRQVIRSGIAGISY